jgi:hypothetical protein
MGAEDLTITDIAVEMTSQTVVAGLLSSQMLNGS